MNDTFIPPPPPPRHSVPNRTAGYYVLRMFAAGSLVPLGLVALITLLGIFSWSDTSDCGADSDCVATIHETAITLGVVGLVEAACVTGLAFLVRRHPGLATLLAVPATGIALLILLVGGLALYQAPMDNPM